MKQNEATADLTRHQKRADRTRSKILKASKELFADRGFDSVTIDEITEKANIGKGTFYYHFKTKENVVAELIRDILGELCSRMKTEIRGIDNLPQLLDTLIGVHIDFFATRWNDFILYYQGRVELKLRSGYDGMDVPYMDYLEQIETALEDVISFDLSHEVLRKIACAVAGFVSGYFSFSAVASERESLDEAFRSLRGAMVASLTRFIKETAPPSSTDTERMPAW